MNSLNCTKLCLISLLTFSLCSSAASDLRDQRTYWLRLERVDVSTALVDGVKFEINQLRVVCDILRNGGREPAFVAHYDKNLGVLEPWMENISKVCKVKFTSLVGPSE